MIFHIHSFSVQNFKRLINFQIERFPVMKVVICLMCHRIFLPELFILSKNMEKIIFPVFRLRFAW